MEKFTPLTKKFTLPLAVTAGTNLPSGFELHLFLRHCTSGAVYESTKITNKLLDANTLYQLDKYSK